MDYSFCIGSDHRGVRLKSFIYDYLVPMTDEEPVKFGISVVIDEGPYDDKKSVDYPDIVNKVVNNLEYQDRGILINRAEVKKWGLNIGVVTITFLKIN